MPRFFVLAGLIASTIPAFAVQTPSYHKLRAVRRNRYDIQMVFPQWHAKAPVVRAANWYYRQKTLYRWKTVRRVTHQLIADAPPEGLPVALRNYYYWNPFVSVQKADLVSGYFFADYFNGGFHPNSETYPINVGLVRGKPQLLSIVDVCKPGKSRAVAAKVFAHLRKIPAASWAHPQFQSLTPRSVELTKTFVITPTGLLFIFDPYVAGPFSNGEIRVKLPYSQLRDELNTNGPLKPVLIVR